MQCCHLSGLEVCILVEDIVHALQHLQLDLQLATPVGLVVLECPLVASLGVGDVVYQLLHLITCLTEATFCCLDNSRLCTDFGQFDLHSAVSCSSDVYVVVV